MIQAGQPLPCRVDHVADFNRRYPGEEVTFFTRVEALATLPNYTLRISLPAGLTPGNYRLPDRLAGSAPRYLFENGACDLLWSAPGEVAAGTRDEFVLTARVGPVECDTCLESRAALTVEPEAAWPGRVEENVALAVSAKGRWLRHLPAVYEEDELMGRFLMLFESFWSPIEAQIDQIWLYFDPLMTPPQFLPWLASWLSLALDEQWTEERRRQLVRQAARLYRRRGTRQALQEYLEIYSGTRPQIVEHRARDLTLGSGTRLGSSLALGRGNVPNTFTVSMRLPALQAADEAERARQEAERRRKIINIIEAEKPAYARYLLRLETD